MLLIVRFVSIGKEYPYILMSLLLDVPFRSFFLTVLGNMRCLFSVLPKMVVSSFPFRTSPGEMSSFVSLILRDHFGGHCHSPPRCRDRPMCNSRFLESGFSPPHPTPFPNGLAGISCLLNCYLVEISTGSLHFDFLFFDFFDNFWICFLFCRNIFVIWF